MVNFIEHDGDVLPAYTGVNQPRYPQRAGDVMPDHTFNGVVADGGQPIEIMQVEPDHQPSRPENPYWPTKEERRVGRAAIIEGRIERSGQR